MLAQQSDLGVGEFIWTGGDCHLYVNHLSRHGCSLRASRCVAHALDQAPARLDLRLPVRGLRDSRLPVNTPPSGSDRRMKQAKQTRKHPHHAHMRTPRAPTRRSTWCDARGSTAAACTRPGDPERNPDRRVPRRAHSHAQADARYEEKGQDDGHTFLFVVSSKVVIDAGVHGNDARFINHSCDPNCETVIEGSRVFIEALRDIKPGEELGYEYGLTWESTDDPDELANYACRCGAAKCRGSMLDPVPLDKKRKKNARARRRRRRPRRRARKPGSDPGLDHRRRRRARRHRPRRPAALAPAGGPESASRR